MLERLLVVDRGAGTLSDRAIRDLPRLLRAGDLLVVNDAATLPVCLRGTARGLPVEVRLVAQSSTGAWSAVLFGSGDWRTRTEDRRPPPRLEVGDAIRFGESLGGTVRGVSGLSRRLVDLELDRTGAAMWSAIYALGQPVQYAHVQRPLSLWHVQNLYASRPWSAEMPSAGRPLSFGVLSELRQRGIGVASLTHAAGLSSTGDPELDAALPWPESFEIPGATVDAIERATAKGHRVVATGTSVVRALEGCALAHGRVVAGREETALILGPGFQPKVVSALLTGMHEPTQTHFALLQAFVPAPLLERAHVHADGAGYLSHEFGDSMLIV